MGGRADTTGNISLTLAETPQDFFRARSLFEEYAASLGFDLRFQNFDQELLHLTEHYGPPSGALLLAFVGNELAGCVALRRFETDICEMKRLFVRPAYRGRGIGRQLADRIVREARRLGYRTMRLDTIASMEAARELYGTLGFKERAAYRHNPVPGAVFMELEIAPPASRIAWQWKSFAGMSVDDLYDTLALRQKVFVVEQRCPYLDADGLDRAARHLMGRGEDGTLAAALRLLPPGSRYDEPSLGRVVTDPANRGMGLGRLLMQLGIDEASCLYAGWPIRVSAQKHLQAFYESLGFTVRGDPYDEDGIPHVGMIRPSSPTPRTG